MSAKVLVVDDNELIRTLVASALTDHGCTVSTVRSGAEALALLDAESFDVLVVDYVMPGMNGDELVHRLRQHARPEVHAIPVIGLCGSQPDAEALFTRAGTAACVAKPVKDRELIAALERVFPGTPSGEDPPPRPPGARPGR